MKGLWIAAGGTAYAQVVAIVRFNDEDYAMLGWDDGAITFEPCTELVSEHNFFASREACYAYQTTETENAE